jgi:pimeloyl-ACP methyl ester carboxylesterase
MPAQPPLSGATRSSVPHEHEHRRHLPQSGRGRSGLPRRPTTCLFTAGPRVRRRPSRRRLTVHTSDGIRLACSDFGQPTADRTVIFLHGLCLSELSWSRHIDYLLRGYRGAVQVISYDHRGHGRSQRAPAGTYRIEQLAADLAHVIAELNVSGSVTFVGHSLGGMAALAYLGRQSSSRPVDPDGLVLVCTAAGHLTTHGLGRPLAAPGLGGLCRLAEHAPQHALRVLAAPACAAIGRWWGCGPTQRATLAALVSTALLTTPASTAAGFLAGLRLYDVVSNLQSIRARTIVVSGEADLLTPSAHSRELVDKIPGPVHLCVRGGGHMLAQQAPHVVAAAIDQAISSSDGVSRGRM